MENVQIVILQRGWVVVGNVTNDGMYVIVNNGAVIRRWGTTKGLGEHVHGPTTKTELDPLNGTFKFHELTVIGQLSVNAKKWMNALK